jgi:hypothetical protein
VSPWPLVFFFNALSNRNQLTNRCVVLGLGTRTPSKRSLPAPLCPTPHGGAFLFRNPNEKSQSSFHYSRATAAVTNDPSALA